MNDPAISIQSLHKTYKDGKQALDNVTLEVAKGSIFALLGPNGAGKSTLINILGGLVKKTSGSAKIWGYDLDLENRQVRASIGIVPQELNLDAFFSPLALLDLQAGLYGVPPKERRSNELLEMLGLADKAYSGSRSLSGGMRRRLMVAKAMVHTPPILILDEPTAGVDIELRQQLWSNIKRLNEQGVTIVLTTHYLQEAEELCDTIAIINHGKIIACEDKKSMLKRLDQKELHATLKQEVKTIPESLKGMKVQITGSHHLKIIYSPSKMRFDTILAQLCKSRFDVVDISTKEANLEDVFLSLTSSKT